jgi:3-phenylpropionate/trans-cinnamate dioxygenase ferredoxin reductase subunit
MRVEHYDNAIKQGTAAAENMLGRDTVFDDPHWFWSDQYSHNLQSVGVADAWDEVVVRGSMAERAFSAFYLQEGRVRSVVALNRGRDILRARKLVHQQVPVDAGQLRDESVDLRKLVTKR